MSRRELPADQRLAAAIREALMLGTTFVVRGAEIEIANAMPLPEALRACLMADPAALWRWCGGDADEAAALAFATQLGVRHELAETRAQCRAAVRRLIADLHRHGPYLAIDVETAPRPEHWRRAPVKFRKIDSRPCVRQPEPDPTRAALDPHRSYVALAQLYAGGDTVHLFRGEAAECVLHSHWLHRQRLVAHSAGFELGFLGSAPFRFPVECSLQATGLLQGTRHRSLRKAALAFLHLDMPKDAGASDWSAPSLSPGQIAYAASDAVVTWRLWRRLRSQLRRTGRERVYALQRDVLPAVAKMKARGLMFDQVEHDRIHHAWDIELADARRAYHDITGDPPPSTPADVQAWLVKVLDKDRLDRWPRTATRGELSTSIAALKRLVWVPSARPVLRILQTEKLVSCFGSLPRFANPVTKRLHPSFIVSGARTGRFSCNDPNLQQLPAQRYPEFRRVIVASPGNVLIGADWELELSCVAQVGSAAIRALTAIYAEGKDLHRITAAATCGINPDQVTDQQRRFAKPTNFGAIYGIGPRSLAEDAFVNYDVDMSIEDAAASLAAFFAMFSTLDAWRYENLARCQREGRITIGAGRVVEPAWYGITWPWPSLPEASSYAISGVCADAMLRALRWADRRLSAAKIRGGLIATVHDELLAEVHRDDADEAKAIIEAAMLDAFTTTFPGAPTVNLVAAKIGQTWFDTH